ncbi:MAG: alpha/beta hydrolase [Micromonosporaceae bacterium]
MARLGSQPHHLAPVPVSRHAIEELTATLAGLAEPVVRREDLTVAGPAGEIPIRIWAPSLDPGLPVLIYLHGGGWVVGSPETHEALCCALASQAGVLVVAPRYRRAPEHRFPAALDDTFALTAWLAEHGQSIGADPARLAVAGDSAGGNLAAAITLRARAQGGPRLAAQVLIYPMLEPRCDTPSYTENATGYGLTAETARWYWKQYLPSPADGDLAEASPLRAADLAGLPPAFVLTCEYDPLRDEGEAYARRLAAAGVPVTAVREAGMIHGYARLPASFDRAHATYGQIATTLRAAFHAGVTEGDPHGP